MSVWRLRFLRKGRRAGDGGDTVPAAAFLERRATVRARTRLRGTVHPGPGLDAIPCRVSDLSAVGASLSLDGAATLPCAFGLSLHGEGAVHGARIVWRDGRRVGIAFAGPRPGVPPVVTETA